MRTKRVSKKKLLENDVTYLNYSLLPSTVFLFCNENIPIFIVMFRYVCWLILWVWWIDAKMKIYKYLNIKKHFILDVLMKLNEQTDSESKLDFAVSVSDATQKKPEKNLWLSFECSVFEGNKKYNHSYVQCSRRVISIINCPSLLIFVLCFYDNDCSFFCFDVVHDVSNVCVYVCGLQKNQRT